ncbi:carbon-nitrogen hydrolase family protein [Streptomyces sp. NBC_01089]|uniref:carbon-nitrogen hydrolase family protein n=1 Tax=Streptomyces sp. NBC_01089 TaxID=2903747 RepID=UPI00386E1109|nr:carbon-nitrogen hydrolase family protein [Streptomyces sp. NBC_01089]
MADKVRIATAQSPVTTHPVANATAVRDLMIQAARSGVRLLHFPEGAISGYPSGGEARKALRGWDVNWSCITEQLELIARLAGEIRLWVVVGSSHRLTTPHLPHNSLYVISDRGQLTDRYDKRRCSHNELSNWYSPGFEPVLFEVDGFRFGTALCIEVNFPELFMEYTALGADCVLLSSFSEDPIFDVLARSHAATQNCWVSVSVPAQCSSAMPSGIVGPHGYWLDRCAVGDAQGLACVDLDRTQPGLEFALKKAGPWRQSARTGEIYRARRVHDARSADRTHF